MLGIPSRFTTLGKRSRNAKDQEPTRMYPAYISALAALFGSIVGSATSLATTYFTLTA